MTEPNRPRPEDLLERYNLTDGPDGGHRGRLRVFLGAAPGVGKTYAMLLEGRRLKAAGHDVLAGLVEPHGRQETEQQIADLEEMPRRLIPYRGVLAEEMDTDAILRRRPAIVLVDELAHTNVPGSANHKRYQDVQRLLDAGIDVVTTMNVQHLESVQDIVAGVTGVEVRETVPDWVLDAADVQLIDLPTDQLLERLRQGKIYPRDRAEQALEHFFRPGNLTALRELALRRTAAGVDDRLESYMREHAIDAVWEATERILVLIDDSPAAGAVIRSAWRLASAMRCDLAAIAVVGPGGLEASSPERRSAIARNIRLAEDLGVTVSVRRAERRAVALAEAARAEHATIIVIGHTAEHRLGRFLRPSLADELLHLLNGVDLYLVEPRQSSVKHEPGR